MKLKSFISLLCMVVLFLQVLPVKQLGSLLCSNGLQEELTHDIEKDTKARLFFKKDFTCTHALAQVNDIYFSANAYIHFATALPAVHAGEIHMPPPNIA